MRSINPNYALYLQPGIYILTEIADVTNCNVQFNQPLVNNYTNISVNNFNHAYDCDSLKEKISFEVSGNAPWILTYQNNTSGIMYQVNSLNPVFSFYVNINLHHFTIARCNLFAQLERHIRFNFFNLYNPLFYQKPCIAT